MKNGEKIGMERGEGMEEGKTEVRRSKGMGEGTKGKLLLERRIEIKE